MIEYKSSQPLSGMIWKALPHAASVFLLLAIALLVFFPIRDYDTFWHLANGRAMAESGHIVNQEIFSYTAFGRHFNNHEWLAQLLFYLFFNAWGPTGLIGFKVLLTLTACLILFRTSRIEGAGPTASALLCLFAVFAALARFVERPHLFTLIGLALLGLILHGYRLGQWGKKTLLWMVPVMILWDLLHGAIFGLVFLGTFVAGESVKKIIHRRVPSWEGATPMPADRLRSFWISVAVTFVIMLLNPYGPLKYDIFIDLINQKTEAQFVGEYLPTPLRGFLPFWVFFAASWAMLLVRGKRADLTHAGMLLSFGYLAVRYNRCIEVFVIIAVPVLAAGVVRLRELAKARGLMAVVRFASAFLVIGALSFIVYFKLFMPKPSPTSGEIINDYSLHTGINDDYFPVGSARFIKAVNLRGNMFNSDRYGGYLSFFLAPERRIFHYNHPSLFNHIYGYVHDAARRAEFDINYAIVARGDEVRMFFREGFVPVYWEPTAMVLVKNSELNSKLIDRYRIRYFQPLMPDARLVALAGDPAIFPKLVDETATYLTYRHDRRWAALFADIVAGGENGLSASDRVALLSRAERYNSDSPELEAALRQ